MPLAADAARASRPRKVSPPRPNPRSTPQPPPPLPPPSPPAQGPAAGEQASLAPLLLLLHGELAPAARRTAVVHMRAARRGRVRAVPAAGRGGGGGSAPRSAAGSSGERARPPSPTSGPEVSAARPATSLLHSVDASRCGCCGAPLRRRCRAAQPGARMHVTLLPGADADRPSPSQKHAGAPPWRGRLQAQRPLRRRAPRRGSPALSIAGDAQRPCRRGCRFCSVSP
ncbi:hypothetical protein PVAP13_1NG164519 [Panicum virgatum]|uniref:Uncharacterized protein n=1 Tax=Panicum virgatum TaxID=38727 RepID=A0A8T0X5G4_PANVG|nr:hypothetical protein PVAP13_1NG164519 [Panicum virgatum]